MKNCPDVREVAIGCYSFSDYTVCEITDVNELKSIAFGEKEEASFNFQYASLELDSLQSLESLLISLDSPIFNLPSLASISFAGNPKRDGSFRFPHKVYLKDLPRLHDIVGAPTLFRSSEKKTILNVGLPSDFC
ncbi:hypothetical protein WA577_007129 [Blastocystis sp. JDR]